jgi:FimV-like protein
MFSTQRGVILVSVLRDLLNRLFGGARGVKLQLAAAYIDMGDKASARKVIFEIIDTGSAEEKVQAEALLAHISNN